MEIEGRVSCVRAINSCFRVNSDFVIPVIVAFAVVAAAFSLIRSAEVISKQHIPHV